MSNFSSDMKVLELLAFLYDPKNKLEESEMQKKWNELDALVRVIDRIHIREYFNNAIADIIEHFLKQDNQIFQLEDPEFQLDSAIQLSLFHADYACNWYKLIPPFVRQGIKIPEKMKSLYAESRLCFVFKQYSAAIVLSRAIIETALKARIGLTEGSKNWTAGITLGKAVEKKIVDEKTYWIADKVIKSADRILHRSENATEKEALNALDHTKQFLEYLFG